MVLDRGLEITSDTYVRLVFTIQNATSVKVGGFNRAVFLFTDYS